MVIYNQSTAGSNPYFNLTSSNVTVSNLEPASNNHRLNVVISGYSYVVLSPGIAGTQIGPAITVSIPLGLYN